MMKRPIRDSRSLLQVATQKLCVLAPTTSDSMYSPTLCTQHHQEALYGTGPGHALLNRLRLVKTLPGLMLLRSAPPGP